MTEISVIIPTYKPGDYIIQCINSMESQTLDHELFEVLLVLNGKDDDSSDFLSGVASNYSNLNIRIIETEEKGVSNARNIGLDKANGKYIAFIDDDDWVSKDYLKFLYESVFDNGVTVAYALDYDETSDSTKNGYVTDAYSRNKGHKNLGVFKGRSFMSSVCMKIIPADIIGKTRFNKKFKLSEDALFMAEISYRIMNIRLAEPKAVYYRRLRSGSASRKRYSFTQRLSNVAKLIGCYLSMYFKHPFSYNIPFFLSRIVAAVIRFK